jgi:hypothetical protein
VVRRNRGPGGSSRGRAEGRLRERVRGGTRRGGGRAGRNRGAFDVGDIERYANRLRDQVGDSPMPRGTASGLGGVASGLAGGSFAHRLQGSDAEGSEEFMAEVRERLDLIEGRLAQLEEEMSSLLEAEVLQISRSPGTSRIPIPVGKIGAFPRGLSHRAIDPRRARRSLQDFGQGPRAHSSFTISSIMSSTISARRMASKPSKTSSASST